MSTRDDTGQPLSEAEMDELDAMFAAIPEERDPYNLSMADGFLTGVLVHPQTILPSQWLPQLVDHDNTTLDFGTAAVDVERFVALIMRRYNELALLIAAREPFEPILTLPLRAGSDEPDEGPDAIALLAFWASGFLDALNAWPGLQTVDAEDLAPLLAAFLRHLPPQEGDEELRRAQDEMRAALPPYESLDDAVDDLVATVLEIADVTRPRLPLRRDEKIGRNAPCPCGSGRKYKHCHGAG